MSAIFILDQNGKPIIQRNYKGDVPLSAAKAFEEFLEEADDYLKPPVFSRNGLHYLFISHNNLYLLVISNQDDNVMMLVSFLNETVSVLEDYFNKLTEESLRKNFVLVYEILDEMMDFGYPQTTQAKVLKEFLFKK
ncbi:AP-1 adaptor complex mu subunit Apm1 [Bonamia ostreae]|uniref:AP-1 adaptor complex mu subunit Apm1 n=1 Tax=Bonamia ostreae TaxID=126728 RepID=A0ABV2AGL3_9EUKA